MRYGKMHYWSSVTYILIDYIGFSTAIDIAHIDTFEISVLRLRI